MNEPVLIVPNRLGREAHPLPDAAFEENLTIAQDAMTEQSGCLVEQDEVEVGARDLAAQVSGEPADRLSPRLAGTLVIDEHGDVEIASAAGAPPSAASEQERQPYLRKIGQGAAQSIKRSFGRRSSHDRVTYRA